jgi:hypothetical protein
MWGQLRAYGDPPLEASVLSKMEYAEIEGAAQNGAPPVAKLDKFQLRKAALCEIP